MSQNMVSPVSEVGFIDLNRSHTYSGNVGHPGLAQVALSITSMDTILLAAPFSLSQLRVDSMTLQDKAYAIRVALEKGTITPSNLRPPIISTASAPTNQVHPYGTVWHNTSVGGDVYQTSGDGTWTVIIAL